MRSPKNRRRLEFIRENSSTPGPATCFPTPRSSGLTISTLNTTPVPRLPQGALGALWYHPGTILYPENFPRDLFSIRQAYPKTGEYLRAAIPLAGRNPKSKSTTVKATLFATRLMPRLLPHRPVESERLVRGVDISEFNIALVVSSAGARRRPIHHIGGHLNPV